MSNDQAQQNFDRVLSIQERTVEALSKVYSQLDLQDETMKELSAEVKELSNLMRIKPCVTEKAVFTQIESSFRAEHVQRAAEHKSISGILTEGIMKSLESLKRKDEKLTDWLKLATLIMTVISIIAGVLIALFK